MERTLVILGILMFTYGCSSKREMGNQELKDLDQAVSSRNYRIEMQVMEPRLTVATQQITTILMRGTGNTANRVDINGRGHYFTVRNDSLIVDLPYIGERRMGGGYDNSKGGIIINDPLKSYTETTTKNGERMFTMNASNGIENYDFTVSIFKNGFSRVNVTSSHRLGITYTGSQQLPKTD